MNIEGWRLKEVPEELKEFLKYGQGRIIECDDINKFAKDLEGENGQENASSHEKNENGSERHQEG